ncbi:MAG TPA: peptidoglycan DD-metalloendopeptidase family protein [Cellvibrio sp.]|nr:peptidoglycan DD-metalloendopeptidase family protein [Cellvibrio sp.]
MSEQIPRGHLVAAGSLAAGLAAICAFAPGNPPESALATATDPQPIENIAPTLRTSAAIGQDLGLTGLDPLAAIPSNEKPAEIKPKEPQWQEVTIKSGDSLSGIFARAGLNDRDIYELFDGNKSAKDLRNLATGQKMAFLVDNDGKLSELKYAKNVLDSIQFTRTPTGFVSQETSLKPEIKRSFRQGTINSSLFAAGKQAGLPNNLTMELANIFGWDVDFALDIKKGDQFKVMFEEQYLDGKKIGTGDILSAEFVNDGTTYQAVRYTNKDGVTRYFTPDGKGMNKAFLRTPVDFARISSEFNLGRLHPVLNTIRAHKGTDYAASTGTPIRATGDGKVILAGRKGGYGNCVIIQHGQGYETLYGHMNNFAKGIATGSRVSQGQIIGYVGSTGLATGPHLHYEFHMNGQVRNPVTVPLPQAMGVAANEKSRFLAATQTLVAQLDEFDKASRLAMGEGTTKSN